MPLQSRRFRNEPRLEAIHAGVVASFLRFGDSGPAVKAVQEALIDAGFAIPDGPTGFFGQQTSGAVIDFKRAFSLSPDDPVAGIQTLTTLDNQFARPDADRREWAESFGRAAEGPATAIDPRPLAAFNFSRFKENERQFIGTPFTFDQQGVQLPEPFRSAFLTGLAGILDPAGSPNGAMTDCGSWGASPFDLYHVHLAVDDAFALVPRWQELAQQYLGTIRQPVNLMRAAAGTGPDAEGPEWTVRYRELLLGPAPGHDRPVAALVVDWLLAMQAESLAGGAELRFLWHSFENNPGRWRPPGMQSTDPRRSWWNAISPAPGPIVQTPFPPGPQLQPWMDLGQLGFLVDNLAAITLMPTDRVQAAALRLVDMNQINALEQTPPLPPTP
jgi:hypothetical protein